MSVKPFKPVSCIKKTFIVAQFATHWSPRIGQVSTWHLFLDASSSMSGLRLRAEEILRIDPKSSSIRSLLWDVLVIFIQENSCSHRSVLPNMENIWAAWVRGGGTVSGIKCWNLCSAHSITLWILHRSSISSIWRFARCIFYFPTANRFRSSSNPHFWTSKLANRRVKLCKLCTWDHSGRDLPVHRLEARENGPGFLAASNASTGDTAAVPEAAGSAHRDGSWCHT